MDDILIKNVLLYGKKANVLIRGNRFSSLAAPADATAKTVIDGDGMALMPPFYNTHTHAAMTLLRGYADDMPLHKWLTEYIWPFEEKLTAADIREGSRLAVREMIKSGTVFFNDMYFDVEETIDVVREYGMRAAIGVTFMETHSKSQQQDKLNLLKHWADPTGGRITLAVAPHSIYTVGRDMLQLCSRTARDLGFMLHIHVSETRKEVEDCLREHGTTPVRYLDELGVLGPEVVAAHAVHVDAEEADILAARGVTIAHCPCSNQKLASGTFPYQMFREAGCRVTLGTDGVSSNNNLDMREEMKFAALIAKGASGDPQTMPASEAMEIAARNGAEAFGIDAGLIAEGKLADAILIRLDDVSMYPLHHLVSNWVYAANSSIVDTVICDGRILMKNREFVKA